MFAQLLRNYNWVFHPNNFLSRFYFSHVDILEKAASGASGACGHFVGNHAILRTF